MAEVGIESGLRVLRISARRIDRINRIEFSLLKPANEASSPIWSSLVVPFHAHEKNTLRLLDVLQQTVSCNIGTKVDKSVDEVVFEVSIEMTLAQMYQGFPSIAVLFDSYRVFRGHISLPKKTSNPRTWRQKKSRHYVSALDSWAKHTFSTSTGIVSLSRDDVQPGDWVCILGGVLGSWILRETVDGYYRIMSTAATYPSDFSHVDVPVEILSIC
jgi:hypothetical protein